MMLADFLDGFAMQRAGAAHGFESVELAGLWLPVIMTAPSAFRCTAEK